MSDPQSMVMVDRRLASEATDGLIDGLRDLMGIIKPTEAFKELQPEIFDALADCFRSMKRLRDAGVPVRVMTIAEEGVGRKARKKEPGGGV